MATATPPSASPPPPPPSQSQSQSSSSFIFPREHSFPPFFTRQPNLAIHHAQLTKWSALVLSYARHHRLFRLVVSSAAESELFCNRAINRKLAPADIREVLDFMRKDGRAEFVRATGGDAGAAGAAGDVVLLYWRKPEEWAALVEAYVEETAQKGSVLTVYELTEGENTRGTEFHGMDNQVLMKALNILVKQGKAQIFGSEDSLGVKFF
ncbi:ESCRT-II complex, vps25 subunit [Trichoderma longibrachiatum]